MSRAAVTVAKMLCYVAWMLCAPYRLYLRRTFDPMAVRRVAVLGLHLGLGNSILLVPMLNALKQERLDRYIAVITGSLVAYNLFALYDWIDEVILYRPGLPIRFSQAARFFATEIRPRGFDLLIGTHLDSVAVLSFAALLSGVKYRVSYNRKERAFLEMLCLTHKGARHEVENHLAVLKTLGLEATDGAWPPSSLDPALVSKARAHLTHRGVPETSPVLGIHPGSTASLKGKRWFADRFAHVADEIARRLGGTVMFFGGPDDEEAIDEIRRLAREPHLYVTNQPLADVMALIQQCRCFLSNDSGLMHVAAALHVPVVALFGPTIPWKNHPWGVEHVILRKALPCSPCYNWGPIECPIEHQCLQEISVAEVVRAIEGLAVGSPVVSHRVELPTLK